MTASCTAMCLWRGWKRGVEKRKQGLRGKEKEEQKKGEETKEWKGEPGEKDRWKHQGGTKLESDLHKGDRGTIPGPRLAQLSLLQKKLGLEKEFLGVGVTELAV